MNLNELMNQHSKACAAMDEASRQWLQGLGKGTKSQRLQRKAELNRTTDEVMKLGHLLQVARNG